MNKKLSLAFSALLVSMRLPAAFAQEPPASAAEGRETVPITRLLSIVAEGAGEQFLVDPRVRADVMLIGQNPNEVEYDDLLEILNVHGYAAVRSGEYVRIVPDANVRSLPIPVMSEGERRPDAEYVSKIIVVRSLPAPFLVPIMRPLIPPAGHLAAMTCSNSLIIVDTAANVARIEELIRAIDTGEPFEPQDCARGAVTPPDGGGRSEELPRREERR